jgi:hypothetical protein
MNQFLALDEELVCAFDTLKRVSHMLMVIEKILQELRAYEVYYLAHSAPSEFILSHLEKNSNRETPLTLMFSFDHWTSFDELAVVIFRCWLITRG